MPDSKNILVIWNGILSKEELESYLKIFLQETKDNPMQLEIVNSPEEFQQKKAFKFLGFTHIIVLCELNWGDKQYAYFYGIELAQREIRMICNLPILFVSFCTRKQILTLDSTKEIISAYGLGNHFIQLPVATEDEIKDFWEMPKLTELEMIDVRHYCAFDSMISAIKHEIKSDNIENTKNRILNVLNNAGNSEDIKEFKEKVLNAKDDTIDKLCDDISTFLFTKDNDNGSITNQIKYKVMLLDDEEESDEIILLIKEADEQNINIIPFRNSNDALKEINDDILNAYSVILTDFRLYNRQDKLERILTYPQGYTFIEESKKNKNLYKYITFSKLPRAFRIEVAQKLNINIETVDKSLMLSTKIGRKAMIEKIIDLAKLNTDQIENLDDFHITFKKLYKEYSNTKNSETDVTNLSIKHITTFINIFNNKHNDIFNKDNHFKEYIVNKDNIPPYKQEFKTKNDVEINEKNLNIFKNILVMRRLSIYMFYWLYCEYNPQTDDYQIKRHNNEGLGEGNCVNAILQDGWIDVSDMTEKSKENFQSAVNSKITNKSLFISGIGGKRITQFQLISLTNEEKVFFKENYPDVYNKWKNSNLT